MLANGAHVKIGTKDFRLAFDTEGAYSYSLTPTGEEVKFWLLDDWIGGEGNDAYDPTDPSVYHKGLVNPRLPGVLTTPPTRATASTGALTPAPDRAFTVAAHGRLYFIGEAVSGGATSYWYTSNMTSFTELADAGWDATIDRITAVCSDGGSVYIVGHNDGNGSYQIRSIASDGSTLATVENYNVTANNNPIVGLAVRRDYLYAWNGNKLRERKIGASAANAATTVDTLGTSIASLTYGTSYWADIINAEDSIFYFLAIEGKTTVFERQPGGAYVPVWNLPTGFTGKAIVYQNGALVVAGEYNNNSAAFGMSVRSRQPLFLGFIRPDTAVSIEVAGGGFGSEILLVEKDVASAGKAFIYDIANDAFSQLDEITHTDGQCWSAGAFLDKRYIAVEDGGDMNIYTWDFDDNPSATVNGRMETGAWDMDLPEDQKQLDGFHVLSNANSTKTVDVYYQDDEDGTWTQAGTATTGFHNYIPVSSASATVTFRSLRVRVDPKAAAEVYAVSARYRVNTYEESWELLLDLTDEEVDQTRSRRRRSNQDKGWQLRDYIRDIADNKTVVTFLDGARYPQGEGDDPDKYSTHTVIVDIPVDRLDRPGEGVMLVRLKSVSTN